MAADLTAIRTKIRRLTRSPSEARISNEELDEYINTFILYDFPEHLRLFSLRTMLTFFTSPYIDTYATNDVNANDPLYNFKNKYTSVHPPMYLDGYYMAFVQSESSFYSNYPKLNGMERIGTGDGVTTAFTGTLSGKPVLQNNVTISSIDVDDLAVTLVDVPQTDVATGNAYQTGEFIVPNNTAATYGGLDYLSGVYTINFPIAPAAAAPIYAHTTPYQAARPSAVLYYDNKFIMRPVPDKVYRVTLEAYIRPTELLAADQHPDLEQHWQYIALGAALKVLEDRMDMDTVQLLMPLFKEQETLCLRKTIVQQSNERTATIYSGQSGMYGGLNRNE